ncbi:prepilin-type N-terminal cleavage/methylation domain-containing protein [uncultured Microbacterium sp.]|uniref:prepilin-type N-terminal cleavage/methylation domain-containing protein n=1 Tax=uncultured Microbacterium sp. TaxID=191216 RepID=UPI002630121E|nr:prepilin-type N-terminal cleavage/methylation domain-containing protein [uncultured Microbacterium sp.]
MSSVTRDDDGVGLIEIVVAMLLLAVLALGVLPLIIQATTASVVNRDLVAANNVATAELAPVRAAFPSDPATTKVCGDLPLYEHSREKKSDALYASRQLVCGGDGTATVTVKVFSDATTEDALVTAVTKVLVKK